MVSIICREYCWLAENPSERRNHKWWIYERVACFIYWVTLISNDNSVENEIKGVFWPAIELILPL